MSNTTTTLMMVLDRNTRPLLLMRAVIFLLYFEFCYSQYVHQPGNSTSLYNVLRRRNHDGPMQDRPRKSSSLTELKQIAYSGRKEQHYDMLNDRQHASSLYAEEQPLRRVPNDKFAIIGGGEKLTLPNGGATMATRQGQACDFETSCAWRWDTAVADGFRVTDGAELATMNRSHGHMSFPVTDASGDRDGKFLHLQLTPTTTVRALVSPDFGAPYRSSCSLEFWLHQDGMANATFRIIVRNPKHEVVVHEGRGNNNNA
ncbi:uncharacterized protein LOC113389483 [Ctenocephalides felis]|uniref:uncharacterized protein LOC113389483 n=1 Tax=Ctenocephalides felis TaxID=7515 RepID=UPI000E6E22F7|nr:uncharacterized protein LOC113389483 [Ctenocephalides felis]